uniref:Uncharacterized protein n=1 Tax=Sphaerodactylus townsendi TaxID=933632 RepID=A0ACB8G9L9_9SAUR
MLVPYLPTLSSSPSPSLLLFLLSSAKDSSSPQPSISVSTDEQSSFSRGVSSSQHTAPLLCQSAREREESPWSCLPPSHTCQGRASAGLLLASSVLFAVS